MTEISSGPRPYRKMVNYGPIVACRLEAYRGDALHLTGHRPTGGRAMYDLIYQALESWAEHHRPRIVAEVEVTHGHRCQLAYGDAMRQLLHGYIDEAACLTGKWMSEQKGLYTMLATSLCWWVNYHEPMCIKPHVRLMETFRGGRLPLTTVMTVGLAVLGVI
jgi:hypothetical protein